MLDEEEKQIRLQLDDEVGQIMHFFIKTLD